MSRIIKNISQIAVTPERRKALAILGSGYRAIKTPVVLKNTVRRCGNTLVIQNKKYNLTPYRRIAIIGIGKCSLEAGEYLAKLLGDKLWGGIILDTRAKKLKNLICLAGTHPLPSAENIVYTKKILNYLDNLHPLKDLLIFIVSGGGSSLFCLPENISLPDYIRLTADLQKSGASIHELNCIRKHLESVKGGKLTLRLKPLQTVALYFSDVLSKTSNKNLETIASGPLHQDNTTNNQAKQILQKHKLWAKYRNKIKQFSETPKSKKDFSHLNEHLLLTNSTALEAMARFAKRLKLKPKVLTATFQSEAKCAFAKIKQLSRRFPKHNLFLAGGETVVRVKGKGKGGRNQEAALGALKNIGSSELFISTATDGIDFSPYAGAIADKITKQKVSRKNLNASKYLSNNDSHTFFRKTGDYLKTGKTGSNVADILLYYRSRG